MVALLELLLDDLRKNRISAVEQVALVMESNNYANFSLKLSAPGYEQTIPLAKSAIIKTPDFESDVPSIDRLLRDVGGLGFFMTKTEKEKFREHKLSEDKFPQKARDYVVSGIMYFLGLDDRLRGESEEKTGITIQQIGDQPLEQCQYLLKQLRSKTTEINFNGYDSFLE